ncbi:helix-turn-helix domain-containing protein [Microbacterium sp. MYb64]|uniref:helix-turn-helix domain-containing protein n=1 Tax=Microbacterium sp. MYb64 TaxID=1848691 RepID=UPI000CFABFDB|nr:helix-turn-helix domain-containing protein [Microbacterium sp. MYb64]PRB01783.1 hypothetical protein CQ044_16685 [Microbacterium sp. MYb64]
MSVKVSSWVWHGDETADLAGNEMILLLALADVAADDGRCVYLTEDDDMTYSGLAKKARVDRRTVIRLVAKLRRRGLVEQRKGTKGQPNEFAIAVPWRRGDNLSPLPDSVTTRADEVTPGTTFGDIADHRTSLIREDVIDVPRVRPGFAEFYLIYPRKVGREAARKAFEKAVKQATPEAVIEGARRFASDPNLPDKQFIPHPATWLNAGRWDDEPLPPRDDVAVVANDFGRDEWMYRA